MEEFKLKTEYIQLGQLLKATGMVESGGMAKQVIVEGFVKVDGVVETQRGKKLRPGQKVEFNNETIALT